MQEIVDSICQVVGHPQAFLVGSLTANAALALTCAHLWRENRALHARIWEVLRLVLPLATRRPA